MPSNRESLDARNRASKLGIVVYDRADAEPPSAALQVAELAIRITALSPVKRACVRVLVDQLERLQVGDLSGLRLAELEHALQQGPRLLAEVREGPQQPQSDGGGVGVDAGEPGEELSLFPLNDH